MQLGWRKRAGRRGGHLEARRRPRRARDHQRLVTSVVALADSRHDTGAHLSAQRPQKATGRLELSGRTCALAKNLRAYRINDRVERIGFFARSTIAVMRSRAAG